MVEGLSAALKKVTLIGVFHGFKVGSYGFAVTHLQYADGTMLIRVLFIENLLTINVVLKIFELALGLKVNFSKRHLFGVNVIRSFLELVEAFLHRKVDSLPFKYLGLFVGSNPKKEGT